MKREFLENLGISRDIINQIMDENGKDIEKAKSDYAAIKAELEKTKGVIAERDSQLSALRLLAGDNEELTKKISELEETNKKAAAAHAAEISELKINAAIDRAMTAARAKLPKAVRALLDMDKIKIDDSGSVVGVDEQIKALSKSENTSFLFEADVYKFRGFQPGASMGLSELKQNGADQKIREAMGLN